MVLERLRRLASTRGPHFAEFLLMGPFAAVAILALRQIHLVARTPIWLIPLILVCGQFLTNACGVWWARSPSRLRLHVRVASQAIVVTATIYATGWGPALAIGLVLVGQESLAVTGSSAQRAVLGWNLSCLAAGQGLIALGWVPSLVPVPEVHGLAVLMGIGIAFSYRSLHTALIEKGACGRADREPRAPFPRAGAELVGSGVRRRPDRRGDVREPSCVKVLGYEPDLVLGSESGVLVHQDEIEDLRNTVKRAKDVPGGTAEFAFRVRHGDGTWRWLEGIATNLLDDPAVHGVVINARDVTERRARLERHAALAELGREVLRETSLEGGDGLRDQCDRAHAARA